VAPTRSGLFAVSARGVRGSHDVGSFSCVTPDLASVDAVTSADPDSPMPPAAPRGVDRILALAYPAAIPVGHRVEVVEYADTRPEGRRRGALRVADVPPPVVTDLDTGIRYMNHVHGSAGGNGANAFAPNAYPFAPRAELVEAARWRGTVAACTIVLVEALPEQHTMLAITPAS
jgi:hypothetical protein